MFDFPKEIIACVTIEIMGENAEKLLNVCAKQRILIWDLHIKNKTLIGKITPKDFKRLRTAKKGTNTKIRIIKKQGVLFYTNKHIKRVGFFCGMAIFLIIVNVLSLFVWGVKVEGNKAIKTENILASCEELGVVIGKTKKSINANILSQKLLLRQPKLAWASINVEGSIVTVNVSEIKNSTDKSRPSNIIANADGVITKIDVTSGFTNVQIGDTVQKGEILVSGASLENESTVLVPSIGSIYAKTLRIYEEENKYIEEKYFDVKTKKRTVLEALFFKIPLYFGSIKEPYTSEINVKKLKMLGGDLPVILKTKTFKIKEKRRIVLNDGELENVLNERIDTKIKKDGIAEYEHINTEKIKKSDSLKIIKTISASENIAKQSVIEN